MKNRVGKLWAGSVALALLFAGVWFLTDCAASRRPGASAPVVIGVASMSALTNSNSGDAVSVRLNITNTTARSLVMGARSVIKLMKDGWITNYAVVPTFIGQAGPGSMASDLTLEAGAGTTVELSSVNASGPFWIEFVCFPQRAGIVGLADSANDKVRTWKSGSQHESHLGDSFIAVTPKLDFMTEPTGPAYGNQPIRAERDRMLEKQ